MENPLRKTRCIFTISQHLCQINKNFSQNKNLFVHHFTLMLL